MKHRDFGKPSPCPTCHFARKVGRLRVQSRLRGDLLKKNFMNYELKTGNADAYAAALRFAVNPVGWLTFYGDYGPGKTHLAAAIANFNNGHGRPAIYCLLGELLDMLRDSYAQSQFSQLMRLLQESPLLVVDEVERPDLEKAWAIDKIVLLFETRYQLRQVAGTVFVMNMAPERRKYVSDDALGWLFTRMYQKSAKVVHVGGGDYRENVE